MLSKMPSSLSYVEAASVPVVAVTAWEGLLDYARLQAGQTVVIHGAAERSARSPSAPMPPSLWYASTASARPGLLLGIAASLELSGRSFPLLNLGGRLVAKKGGNALGQLEPCWRLCQ
jgi:hypothetical protein